MTKDVTVALALVVTLLLGLPGELLPLGVMDGVGDTDGVIDGDTVKEPLPLVELESKSGDILGEFVTDGVTDSDRDGESDGLCGATQLTVLMRLL